MAKLHDCYSMTLPLLEHITYGPVASRRLGRSLGVNLLPPGMKVCNMNCAYCQYGWTRLAARYRGQGTGWPTPEAVEAAVEARLTHAAVTGETIDRLTIAGHGEPTLHPDFEDIVERLAAVRDRVAPSVRTAILSNSTTAGVQTVRNALARIDERYMKLDAGDSFTFAAINGTATAFTVLVERLRALPPIVIQAMFVTEPSGRIDNSSDRSVDAWIDAVESLRATGVHVYTLDRAPAHSALQPVPARRLREIAERVKRIGIPADVFC